MSSDISEDSKFTKTYDSSVPQWDPSSFIKRHKVELDYIDKLMRQLANPVLESTLTYKEVIAKARLREQLMTVSIAEHRSILSNAIKKFLSIKYKGKPLIEISNHYDLYDSLTNDIEKCYLYQLCPEFKRFRCILAPTREKIHGWRWIKDHI